MDDFLRVMDPNQNGVAHAFEKGGAMDPEQNGFLDKMDPARNGVKNNWDLNFNRKSINQQNTILKGTFSTDKNDKEQANQAMLGGGNVPDRIYDHPVNKPNNYDPIYNPDPKLAPPKTSSTGTSTYLLIGGAAIILFMFYKK